VESVQIIAGRSAARRATSSIARGRIRRGCLAIGAVSSRARAQLFAGEKLSVTDAVIDASSILSWIRVFAFAQSAPIITIESAVTPYQC
jgi:hypothetical protein